jgi:hypothetical protein
MRCISKTENVQKPMISQLFSSISCESPIGGGHVSILTSDYPGSTPENPMAFVITEALGRSDEKKAGVPRRLASRVGKFFRQTAKTEAIDLVKVDERPPEIEEPYPVAFLENPPAPEAAASAEQYSPKMEEPAAPFEHRAWLEPIEAPPSAPVVAAAA